MSRITLAVVLPHRGQNATLSQCPPYGAPPWQVASAVTGLAVNRPA